MKKILFSIIFIFYSSSTIAHLEHYNNLNKIEMEILRNNEVIGYNYYFFKRENNKTSVSNKYKFTVNLFGAKIFEVEGYGNEKYFKNKLISFQSQTLQNGKKKFVNLIYNEDSNKFDIEGSSFTGEAEPENIIGNWWSHKILQANSQISPISGSIKEQIVTFIGNQKINLYGKNYETEHFKLTSKDITLPENKKLNFDIWLDKKTSMIIKVSYERMGKWEYRLKNFE